jgi:hypothetical protein
VELKGHTGDIHLEANGVSEHILEKRMAVTKEHLRRAVVPMLPVHIEIQRLTEEAEKRGIEWNMIDITLRIIDTRYLKAVADFSEPIGG